MLMEIIPIGIAAEIRGEMAKQRMTQAELARATGLSVMTISRKIGSETRDLTMLDLWKICKALNVPIIELMKKATHEPDRAEAQLTATTEPTADRGEAA